jgi:predicted ester cyclase
MKHPFLQFFAVIALAVCLCLALSGQKKTEKGITDEEAKALIENALKAYNEGKLDLIEKVWAPEYILHEPMYPEGIVGLDALRKAFVEESKTFTNKNLKFEGIFGKGDKIVAFFTWAGTHSGPLALPGGGELPATGKKLSYSGVYIGRIVNGKSAEEWFFYNPLEMLLPLGYKLVPPQPPEPEAKK